MFQLPSPPAEKEEPVTLQDIINAMKRGRMSQLLEIQQFSQDGFMKDNWLFTIWVKWCDPSYPPKYFTRPMQIYLHLENNEWVATEKPYVPNGFTCN